MNDDAIAQDARELYKTSLYDVHARTDRLFAGLMIFQWLAAVIAAYVISPRTWAGGASEVHLHVWAAVLVGGIVTALPVALALLRPGEALTRHVIAIGQMLASALLIHVTGGRIETHFHVFGSLAFLAFYRDWRVLLTATVVTAADHVLRGIYWPQSVYGVLTGAEWRWLEHAGWVIFEDAFLIASCRRGDRELEETAARRARLEWINGLQASVAAFGGVLRGLGTSAELSQAALKHLGGVLDAPLGAVYLIDPSRPRHFELVASRGHAEGDGLPRAFDLGEGLLGEIAQEGEVVIRADLGEQIRVSGALVDLRPRSLLIAPLMNGGACEGVVALASLREIKPREDALFREACVIFRVDLAVCEARARTEHLLRQSEQLADELRLQNMEISAQQAELDRKNRELIAADRHKSAFLASMSHELRTPLNAMIGYTTLSLSGLRPKLEEREVKNLEKAESAARTLLSLLNDVLDFSKIEAGRMEVYPEEVELGEVVQDCLDVTGGLLVGKEVEVRADLEAGLPTIQSDYTRLRQVLNNLLGNAAKATEAGLITVAVRRRGERIAVEVHDTGCGIPAEQLETIFEAFKQIDESSGKRFGGTGLGLAITKRLCELLQIELSVTSEVGVGSCFVLSLPLALELSEPEVADPEPAARPSPAPPSRPAPQALPKKPRSGGLRRGQLVESQGRAALLCLGSEGVAAGLVAAVEDLPLSVRRCETTEAAERVATSEPTWALVLGPDELSLLASIASSPTLARLPILCSGEAPNEEGLRLERVRSLPRELAAEQLVDVLLEVDCWRRGEVLVVDDSEGTRELHREVLTQAGYAVREAADGRAALEALEEALPQAILLDLCMPKLDGFGVLKALQANPSWRRIPVLVLTGQDLTVAERRAVEAGASLLRKQDCPVGELSERVNELVSAVSRAGANRVLVVDDNEMNRDLIGEVFRKEGYVVHLACDGAEGIELARESVPDVVVMDLAMPGIDGFEATRALREDPATREIVILACSAFALDEYRREALEAGCDGFLTKPIEPAQLVSHVKGLALSAKVRRRAEAAVAVR